MFKLGDVHIPFAETFAFLFFEHIKNQNQGVK